jgi:hypothetical protein
VGVAITGVNSTRDKREIIKIMASKEDLWLVMNFEP